MFFNPPRTTAKRRMVLSNRVEGDVRPLNYDRLGFFDGIDLATRIGLFEGKAKLKGHYLKRFYDELSTYQAPFLEEKLLLTQAFNTSYEYQEAFTEWKKFVALSVVNQKDVGMTSDKVDSVWHQFILFTQPYQRFSRQFAGGYFHHRPYLPSDGAKKKANQEDEVKTFITLYKQTFGKIPAIWNICDCGKTHTKVNTNG
jgi:hypothetical protein